MTESILQPPPGSGHVLAGRPSFCRLLALCAALLCTSATGADIQSLTDIETTVQRFVAAEYPDDESLDVSVHEIDPRLRLTACATPLTARWAPGSRSIGLATVRVKCESDTAWQLHVQVEVSREADVWVLVRSADRGTLLSADMVRKERTLMGRNLSMLMRSGTPVQDIEPWLGYEFRQAQASGELLNEQVLVPRTLVTRGETVRVLYMGNGLRIETRAVALSDGARDQRLQVKNTRSGKIVEAVVAERGLVTTLN